MISNFQIRQGATVPYFEVVLTKDGRLPMSSLAASGAAIIGDVDPNAVDLTLATGVFFQLFACGREPVPVVMSGMTEIADAASGLVRYKWHPNDTSVKGLYYGMFTATFSADAIFKWPLMQESLIIEVV